MKLDIVKKVMTKHKTHNLFVIDRFHLLPDAKKPIQALTGQRIGELCCHDRSAMQILQEDLTNSADAMAELSTRHVF
jgi:hypothetical protein